VAVDISRVVASAIEAAFEPDEAEPRRSRSRHRGVKVVAAGAVLVAAARVASSQASKLRPLDAVTTLGKVTRIPDMARNVPDRVRDRLRDSGWIDEESEFQPDDVAEDEELEGQADLEEEQPDEAEEEPEAEEPEAEEPEAEEPEAEEPEDEGDEGPDDDGGDRPDDGDDDGGGGDAADAEEEDEDQVGVAASGGGSAVEQAAEGLGLDTNGDRSSARGAVPDVMGLLGGHREPPPLVASADRTRRIDPVARPPEPPPKESGEEAKPSRSTRSTSSKSGSASSKSGSGSSKSTSSKSGAKSSKSSSRPKSKSSSSSRAKSGSTKSGSTKSGSKKAKAGSR
jgi:hypothetical protein